MCRYLEGGREATLICTVRQNTRQNGDTCRKLEIFMIAWDNWNSLAFYAAPDLLLFVGSVCIFKSEKGTYFQTKCKDFKRCGSVFNVVNLGIFKMEYNKIY